MALFDGAAAPAEGEHQGSGGTPAPRGPAAQENQKRHREAMIAIAVGIIGALIAYLAYRSNSSSSSTTAATTPTSTVDPNAYNSGYGGYGAGGASNWQDAYQSLSDSLTSSLSAQSTANQQAIAGLQSSISALGAEIGAQQATSPQQAAAAGAASAASPSLVNIGGSNYYALGNESPTGSYTGLNVSGGYPVLATWIGQGIPSLFNAANPGAYGGGTLDLFTPADTPTSAIGNYGTEQLGGAPTGGTQAPATLVAK